MESFRQKALRLLYPLVMKGGKASKNGTVLNNDKNVSPTVAFSSLHTTLSNGKDLNFADFKGKKVLLVNTASDCGYTGQYAELQSLYEKLGEKLVVIAFPSNDFKEQEKATDKEIASFCQLNYGVSFPIAKKGIVINKKDQQPVFEWLTDSKQNGWCSHNPDWNFSKYLINEKGMLTNYFGPSISPLNDIVTEAIQL